MSSNEVRFPLTDGYYVYCPQDDITALEAAKLHTVFLSASIAVSSRAPSQIDFTSMINDLGLIRHFKKVTE
jgi:hypothetical protein